MPNPSSSRNKIKPVVPKLFELIDTLVYGDMWERAELSKRDRRMMITIATLIGMRLRPTNSALIWRRRSITA